MAVVLALGTACAAPGQGTRRIIEEPQWLRLRLREVSAGVYAEGRFEQTDVDGSTSTHDRFFVGPLVGLDADGSVYHPNLFRFIVNSENAVGWAEDKISSPARSVSRSEFEYRGRVSGSGTFLAHKPYRSTIFGDYDHGFRDYDFFNRVVVDSSRYGVKVGYDEGPVPIAAVYTHYDEHTSGEFGDTLREQDVFNLSARNERGRASSAISYNFDRYTRDDFGREGSGVNHTITASDTERFGSRDEMRLFSTATYNRRDDITVSDEITASMNFSVEHRPNLASFYDFTYDNYQEDAFDSSSYIGRGELRHQLYESLTSSLILQGSNFESEGGGTEGSTTRLGIGFAEAYTKKIGQRHRLHASNSFMVEQVDEQGASVVRNERHTFTEATGGPDSFFLNLPNVDLFTIVVTDVTDSQPGYVNGLDYEVIRNGDRTIIRRLVGSRIGATEVVLVDYEGEPTAAGQYQAFTDVAQIRFDFFDNFLGVYGRMNLFRNNADTELRVPNITSYAVGTDVGWRQYRAGAEYEIYDSDLSRYNSARLFQSAAYSLDGSAYLSLNFSQSWTDYKDADRQEQNYRFITRYNQALNSRFRYELEGGINLRRGDEVEQDLGVFRAGLTYVIGLTTIQLSYDYEYDLYLDREERMKHLFFLRAKRRFW